MKSSRYHDHKNVAGSIIKEYRENLGLSREKLTTKLALLGVTLYDNDIYLIENNKRAIKDFELLAICKILKIDCEDLKKMIKG